MNRKGNCWDSAAAESFPCSLRKARIQKGTQENREAAISDVAESLETFYNRTRHHSHLGGLRPEQFE
jgi:putative transposase